MYEIDFVSLSYTRSCEDVLETRDFLASVGLAQTKIYAKLESRQSLLNFKGTLNAADGIIISRGNLGLDCLPEKMALIQKTLIQTCNLVGKPVILTRVVDTMAVSPRPTRAEATGEPRVPSACSPDCRHPACNRRFRPCLSLSANRKLTARTDKPTDRTNRANTARRGQRRPRRRRRLPPRPGDAARPVPRRVGADDRVDCQAGREGV
jgi:hypothetical protein